ncbi:hypothetical protein U1707_07570 [Sphingomonas sp. PB2P12]|uniref:hypothetical protein n=1 Tax=Sphingomonas sandaracina TaxID=3096157 RepID=UPI002FCADDA2
MVAFFRKSLIRSVPVYGACIGAAIVMIGVFLLPTTTLESLVWTTGVAALIPAAAPPLGTTARLLLAFGGSALTAALLWSSLYLLFGPGGLLVGRARRDDDLPVVRRADAHPDAPPRKPMSAADLGTPMMEVGVGTARDERAIPVDLDLPLASFDPAAILPAPMAPARRVSSLIHIALNAKEGIAPSVAVVSEIADAGQLHRSSDPRVESGHPDTESPVAEPTVVTQTTFQTEAPKPIESTEPRSEPTQPQTIEALLRRLEQGASRRRRIGAH